MRLLGMDTSASCPAALEMLKPLAERLDPETKLLEYANSAVSDGELDSSALAYLLAGYSGMEWRKAMPRTCFSISTLMWFRRKEVMERMERNWLSTCTSTRRNRGIWQAFW